MFPRIEQPPAKVLKADLEIGETSTIPPQLVHEAIEELERYHCAHCPAEVFVAESFFSTQIFFISTRSRSILQIMTG
jgi:hypothetical protein